MGTVETRVARGAAWLDANQPGWERTIDLAALDMADACRCVLGHVFALQAAKSGGGADGYWWATVHFYRTVMKNYTEGFVRGGPGVGGDDPDEISQLDEAWISLIKERFASGLLSDHAVAVREAHRER